MRSWLSGPESWLLASISSEEEEGGHFSVSYLLLCILKSLLNRSAFAVVENIRV